MSNYVLSFRGRPDRTVGPDEEAAWGAWFAGLGSAIADSGHRVGRVQALGNSSGTSGTVLAGYIVVAASDLDTAVRLAEGCPGLKSGATVEVGEVVEM
jgi:hypothetical protein